MLFVHAFAIGFFSGGCPSGTGRRFCLPIAIRYSDPFDSLRSVMHARLTIEQGRGIPMALELPPGLPVTLGRSRDNTVILQDEHASRQHAALSFEHGAWCVRDMGTLN